MLSYTFHFKWLHFNSIRAYSLAVYVYSLTMTMTDVPEPISTCTQHYEAHMIYSLHSSLYKTLIGLSYVYLFL